MQVFHFRFISDLIRSIKTKTKQKHEMLQEYALVLLNESDKINCYLLLVNLEKVRPSWKNKYTE